MAFYNRYFSKQELQRTFEHEADEELKEQFLFLQILEFVSRTLQSSS